MADVNSLQEVIRGALLLIGAVGQNEQPTADEAQDAMTRFNDLLDSWSAERLSIFTVQRTIFPLTGASSYTLGPGGTWNYPFGDAKIEEADLQVTTTTPYSEVPLKVYSTQEFARITVKNQTTSIPRGLYNDNQYPLDNITLYPLDIGINNAVLYLWQQLSSFANLSTDLVFPHGYKLALQFGLADLLAPYYGVELSESAQRKAVEYKSILRRKNSPDNIMSIDAAALMPSRVFNWLTGEAR